MSWSADLLMHRRRVLVLFAVAEILLAMAIPFVLIQGYHTLLDSRAGTFVEAPTRSEPGWTALVAPSTVVGVAEVDRGVVSGVTLLVHNPEQASVGSAIVVPGTLELDGLTLDQRTPDDAVAAVSTVLRLGIERVEVLDAETWGHVLGGATYGLDNPDPVPTEDGSGVLVPVGPVEIDAASAAAFVGRPANGASPVSVLVRRELFWAALLAEPPATSHPLALDLADLDPVTSMVFRLPVTALDPVASVDEDAIESLVRDVVAYPTGSTESDRLRVRIVDRTGRAALESIAAGVAAQGVEVVEIANASVFDGGATQIIAPVSLVAPDGSLPPRLTELTGAIGVEQVEIDDQPIDDFLVTVVVGSDFDLDVL